MKIRFTVLVFSALMVLASSQFTSASSGSSGQVLYSINMPGNPFQQGYYQMMIKKDNENTQMSFANSASSNAYTKTFFLNSYQVDTNPLYWNSDFGAFAWNGGWSDYNGYGESVDFRCPVGMYGIIPYVSRGYTEGAADTLYMQRPAQITLPFLPTFGESYQAESQIPIVATLPDYQDVFFSFTDENFKAGYSNDSILPTALGDQLPCWYNFCCATYYTSGMTCLGAISALGLLETPSFGYFNLYVRPGNYTAIGANGYQNWGLGLGNVFVGGGVGELWPAYYAVWGGINWFSTSTGTSYTSSTPWFLSFSPIIAPGYNGLTGQMVTTVLPQGDLGGNFAGYLDTVNSQGSTATYDGLSVESMNLFQVFAQNMQWFSKNTSTYQGQGASNYNISPGQGVFADAMQLSAIQADFVPNSGSSSNSSGSSDLFYGSYGNGNNLSELSVLINNQMSVLKDGNTTTQPFITQQPILSKITTANFMAAPYMTYAPTDYNNDSLPQAAITNYYNGINTAEVSDVYLPLYFADPGTPLPVVPGASVKTPGSQEIGWNYCDAGMIDDGGLMVYKNPQYYSKAQATMTDFTGNLTGTRAANQPVN